MGLGKRRRPFTVQTSVIGGFTLCVVVLAALIVGASGAASDRERARAFDELQAAAEAGAAWLDPGASSVEAPLTSFASDPGVQSLDPNRCQPVFDALANGVGGTHIHVLDASGREVCSLRVAAEAIDDRPLPRGEWADRALREGGLVHTDPLQDPLSRRLAVIYALPVGDGGAVMAAVIYTGDPPLEIPGLVDGVRLVVLDRTRHQVLATSTDVDVAVGTSVMGTDLAAPVSGSTAVTDLDGARRYYREAVVPRLGWHVLAGYDEDVALGGAHSQKRWMLGIGGGVVAVVLILALALVRYLALPLRRFASTITRVRDGDLDARAAVAGPAEVVDAAELFNALIDERTAREADLERRATHDVLTGLLNRAAVVELLEELVARREPCAVLFLDLDRFKLVNDAHGHAIGDELLVALAASLARVTGPDVTLARFGGDEFVAVCRGDAIETRAVALAAGMLAVAASPVEVCGLELFVTGSVGIAVAAPGDSALDLVRNADIAMYRSKAGGTGGFRVFDRAMHDWNVERLTVEHDLRRALDDGSQLVVHYQPICELDDPTVRRAEALVRWRHPTRGLLYPGDFIEIAEDAGLIGRLGRAVLVQATQWAAARPGVEVSVNVSAAQLAGGLLIDQVRGALATSGLDARRLCVEVTETALLGDRDAAADTLHRIRDLGVKVAIDDFGTGWSSLSWLQTLPVDEVKIDRTFTQGLPDHVVSNAIVRALVDLSRSIGFRLVAEGIETVEQRDALEYLGVTTGQGYLIGRPQAAEDWPPTRTSRTDAVLGR